MSVKMTASEQNLLLLAEDMAATFQDCNAGFGMEFRLIAIDTIETLGERHQADPA